MLKKNRVFSRLRWNGHIPCVQCERESASFESMPSTHGQIFSLLPVIVHYATSAMKRFLTSVSLQHEPKASDVITLVKKTFFARVSYEILYHEVWNKSYYFLSFSLFLSKGLAREKLCRTDQLCYKFLLPIFFFENCFLQFFFHVDCFFNN